MRQTILIYLGILISPVTWAQHPTNVMNALTQSGNNRGELESLLDKYKKQDKEKYDAACFLISSMPFHEQSFSIVKSDKRLHTLLHQADSTYYSLVRERNDSELFNEDFNTNTLSKADQKFRKMMEEQEFEEPTVNKEENSDIQRIEVSFLEKQIEHAFRQRKKSPYARNLKFKDFLEYVLPYKSVGASPSRCAEQIEEQYGKYLHVDTTSSISNVVWRYNLTAKRLRYWGGNYPFTSPLGWNEMFFLGVHDCVSIADYCTQIFRACGIPAATEYNIAYKFWNGRHYHVSVPTPRGWQTFSPESGLPKHRDLHFYEALNIYRLKFGIQHDNPYMLKSPNEPIPECLSNPCIEDVTSEIGEVIELNLPFRQATNHKLAYLGTFVSGDLGLIAATWGVFDNAKQSVTFKNVVPDNLYFPIYMDETGDYHTFGDPFLLSADSTDAKGYHIEMISDLPAKTATGIIERKFPRKPHLMELAKKVPGTYIIASNTPDFEKADTLGVIRNIPSTSWEEIELVISRPYQYYRICGTGEPARIYLSEIQFLTYRNYGYTNIMPPSGKIPHSQEDDSIWIRLLDEPLDKCRWKAEYDGNPQTAPDRWPNVTLKLKEPQYVHRLRYMVKHADNAVKDGCSYELREWSDGFWRRIRTHLLPTDDTISVPNLKIGKYYWLHSLNGGAEELPFWIDEQGKQHFPHDPFLEKLYKIKQKH